MSKHFLITRWNAPVFPTRKDLHHLAIDTEWLESRMELFLKYTYPSICAQTEQDFEWICWFHEDTPKWVRIVMEQRCDRATVIYEDSYEAHIDTTVDTLITTRMDNDDMIHRDFVKSIHAHIPVFESNDLPRQVYVFLNGYRHFLKDNRVMGAYQTNNPFLTLFADMNKEAVLQPIKINKGIEPVEVSTDYLVYCINHGYLPDLFKDTYYNEDLSAWCWTKHSTNTAAIAAKSKAQVDSSILKEFGYHA